MGVLSVHVVGGRRESEVGIGGGAREWNVEFILLGVQLFILIFAVSCSLFLISGLNPDSTSFPVAELRKADTVGHSPAPSSHRLSPPRSKLLKGRRKSSTPRPPQPKMLAPYFRPHCDRPSVIGS